MNEHHRKVISNTRSKLFERFSSFNKQYISDGKILGFTVNELSVIYQSHDKKQLLNKL